MWTCVNETRGEKRVKKKKKLALSKEFEYFIVKTVDYNINKKITFQNSPLKPVYHQMGVSPH
jgi:hypothetical protein